MPLHMITYDLRKARNYQPLWDRIRMLGGSKLLESVWLTNHTASSVELRDDLSNYVDNDDGLAVIELKPNSGWATLRVQGGGQSWLQSNIP